MRRPLTLALLISLLLLGMGSGTALAGSGTPTKAAMPVTGTGNTATTGTTGTGTISKAEIYGDKYCPKLAGKYDRCETAQVPVPPRQIPTAPVANCPASTGTVGVPYNSAITGTSGTPPYILFGASALPAGLTLNSATGAITGTPTTTGTTNFTVFVQDVTTSVAGASCSITTSPALNLTCPSATGSLGTPYNSAIVASGGDFPFVGYTADALPPGLTLNSSTGQISGTPTAVDFYPFTATATNSAGQTISRSCSITIRTTVSV